MLKDPICNVSGMRGVALMFFMSTADVFELLRRRALDLYQLRMFARSVFMRAISSVEGAGGSLKMMAVSSAYERRVPWRFKPSRSLTKSTNSRGDRIEP